MSETDRAARLEQLRDRIRRGSYRVDPEAVARAILANPARRDSVASWARRKGSAGGQCS